MAGYFKSVKFTGEGDVPFSPKQVNGKLRVSNQPYLYDIAEGNIPGHKLFSISGFADNIDDVLITLWPGNSAYVFPNAPMQMEIVSSSASDTSNGVGARTIDIHYQDTARVEKTEIITLNGTTPVATLATDLSRICYLHVRSAGSTGANVGTISLRHLADTPVYEIIPIGYNQSISARCSVPSGKILYLTGIQISSASVAGGHYAQALVQATSDIDAELVPGIFLNKIVLFTQDNGMVMNFECPIKIPALADVKISVVSDTGTANVLAGATLLGWIENESD